MNKRAILQLDLQGNLIQEHESTKAAARSVEGEGAAISHSAMKGTQYRGYLWKYNTELPPRRNKIEVLEEWNINLLQDLEERIDELENFYVTSKIKQIILNNDTINELMQEEQPNVTKLSKGRPSIAVKQFNSEGQYIKTFNSIKDASIETNETPDKIRSVINGKTPLTPRGWHYQRVDTKTKTTRDKNENDDEAASEYLDFYIPRGREDRKKLLYNYVTTRLENYYFQLTKKEAIMHKQFLTKLIKSL